MRVGVVQLKCLVELASPRHSLHRPFHSSHFQMSGSRGVPKHKYSWVSLARRLTKSSRATIPNSQKATETLAILAENIHRFDDTQLVVSDAYSVGHQTERFEILQNAPNLEDLTLHQSRSVAGLSCLTNLTSLALKFVDHHKPNAMRRLWALDEVLSLPKLRHLTLEGVQNTPTDWSRLPLESLALSTCFIPRITGLHRLQTLHINLPCIKAFPRRAFPSMPALTSLRIEARNCFANSLLALSRRVPNVQHLWVVVTELSSGDMATLRSLHKLQSVRIGVQRFAHDVNRMLETMGVRRRTVYTWDHQGAISFVFNETSDAEASSSSRLVGVDTEDFGITRRTEGSGMTLGMVAKANFMKNQRWMRRRHVLSWYTATRKSCS
jgi:hypothetical protein